MVTATISVILALLSINTHLHVSWATLKAGAKQQCIAHLSKLLKMPGAYVNRVEVTEEREMVEEVSRVVTEGAHRVALVQRVFQPHKPEHFNVL